MKILGIGAFVLFLCSCSTGEKSITQALKNNPEILFKVIEENPEKFIEVVNKAARKAQERHQARQMEENQKQQEEQFKNPLKINIEGRSALYGSNDADITIVEYADFQCPACGMAYQNLKPIKDKYKEKVRIFYKHMPLSFHKQAYLSALYLESISLQSTEKARRFYELLFENQNKLDGEEFLKQTANKLNLNMGRLAKDLKSDAVRSRVDQDMAEFERLGFTGTPVIIVNGVALHGAQPTSEIEKVIERTTSNNL